MEHSLEAARALALERVRVAQINLQTAWKARLDAIQYAAEVGCALREIESATAGEMSYEAIRRAVGDRAGVAFQWDGQLYEITEPQVRALAYKADGYGRGAFPGDVALLGVGDEWLPSAKRLAWEIQKRHARVTDEPLPLDESAAYALTQILRLTYMSRPSRLADLADVLVERFALPRAIPRMRLRGGVQS